MPKVLVLQRFSLVVFHASSSFLIGIPDTSAIIGCALEAQNLVIKAYPTHVAASRVNKHIILAFAVIVVVQEARLVPVGPDGSYLSLQPVVMDQLAYVLIPVEVMAMPAQVFVRAHVDVAWVVLVASVQI